MQERYKILSDMGGHLVETQAILPLLDGFDELPASRQADFIPCVNTFQRQQTRLVICSRKQAYELQEQKLALKAISEKECPYSGCWCRVDQNVILR